MKVGGDMDYREIKFDRIGYQNEYNRKNYDRITVMVPKGEHAKLKEIAKSDGVSVNKYIITAIEYYKSRKVD